MTTIAKMTASIEGDERPLRAALQRSESLIQNFAMSAQRQVAAMGARGQASGVQLGESIVRGARAAFERKRGELVDALLGGRMTTDHFERQGEEAAKAFQDALRQGMDAMRSGTAGFTRDEQTGKWRGRIQHLDPGELMQGLAVITAAAEREGMQAAEEFSEAMFGGLARESGIHEDEIRTMFDFLRETATREGTTVGALLAEGMQIGYTQQWNAMKAVKLPAMANVMQGRRPGDMGAAAGGMFGGGRMGGIGANALFGAMFALEGMTRAQGKAEKAAVGLRSALQTVAIAASTKGPFGLGIAAAALGLTFLVDKFAGASKAAREFKAELAGMINAGDSLGLQRQLQTLEFGSPADGAGLGGGFKGSIRDLEAQRSQALAARDAADKSWNFMVYSREKRRVEELDAMLAPLYEKQATLREAILNPAAPLRAPTGLAAVTVTANSPARQAREDMEALRAQVATLTTAWEQLNKPGERTVGLMQQVVATYDRLGQMLATVNPFSEQANTIRAMREDLEKTELIQLRMGKTPITADRLQMMSTTPARPEWAQNVLKTPIVTPGGTGGIMQPGAPGSLPGPIQAAIVNDFKGIGQAVGGTLLQAFGPIAAVMEILRPALEIVAPLFSALMAPLAAVGQVLATLIEPVFRLLFPVIKAVAIGLSYLGEMIARVVAGIAQAVGGLLVGIGNLLNKLPGSIGNPIKRLGESVLNFANGVKASANKMAETRRELQRMEFGQTASDITGLGTAARDTAEALSNVPEIFKLTLAQLRHFGIETVYGQQQQTPPSGNTMAGMSIGEVTIILPESTSNPRETAKAVVQELEQVGMAYGMGTPWSAVPSTAL